MISIYTSYSFESAIKKAIASELRLDELVTIKTISQAEPLASANDFIVDERGIVFTIDWHNVSPPILLTQPLAYHTTTLLGLIFARLGNYERAYDLLAQETLLLHAIDAQVRLAQNVEFETAPAVGNEYRSTHNAAIVAHYGEVATPVPFDEMRHAYYVAMSAAPNDELKAFTAKHYATLLADTGDTKNAELILLEAIKYALTETARIELKTLLSTIWLDRLMVPYDELLMTQLKELLWECLTHYEKTERPLQAALVLMDASQVANFNESFSEALGYISKAADLLRKEDQPELLAQVQMRKGTLLYTWAQQGNIQFYKGAMEALQEAAKVFTREAAPQQFAEIQHLLGIIYSEIPDEAKKKGVWAAVSSSSFKEALNFFTKEQYPYEYATICNHYANAYIKYPASRNSDNVAKSLEMFNQALEIRTAERYPMERALTLLNYVEASWYADNGQDELNEARFNDMTSKLREIEALSSDPTLSKEVAGHRARLEKLKALM
jgi:tetratricopeptide (TPR) repeat protein